MNLKSSKKVETNRYELVVEIDAEAFEAALNRAYKKEVRKISVPGFRKGKAPRRMIEKLYGESFFYEQAVNDLYPAALEEAVQEANLEVVDHKIDFDIESIGKEGLTFKVVVTVKPEVELGEYKGLPATLKKAEVAEEEITQEINRLRERNSRLVAVERAAEEGDTAVIDFEGFLGGKPFEGGKGEDFNLALGSHQFVPGFEEQIIGHTAGEEFEIGVTFPEDYGSEELAGKETQFKIKLHEVKTREYPELDDEFAKDVSESCETLEELKNEIAGDLLAKKVTANEEAMENELLEKVVEGMKAEIPEAMIESRIDESLREFDYRLQSQGMNLEAYLKYTGTEADTFRKTFRENAERQVKTRLALEKIVELERIEPTEEELNQEFEKYAKAYGMEVEKIKELVPEKEIARDLSVAKAIELVRTSAEVTEEAAKKPAAKKPAKKADAAEGEKKTAAKKPAAKKAAAADGDEKKPAKKPAARKKAEEAPAEAEEK